MSKTFRLGVDLDGVLCDFNYSFIEMLEKVSGKQSTHDKRQEPLTWAYPTSIGFTKEDENNAWAAVRQSFSFWMTLKPLFEAQQAMGVLAGMSTAGHDIYFITTRMGQAPQLQSQAWCAIHGFEAPSVLIAANSEAKGLLAKGLDLTHFIDDKPSNCFAVDDACNIDPETKLPYETPRCQIFLRKAAWNDYPEFIEECQRRGIMIVTSLRAFFEELIKEERAGELVV